jgi:uncharacterized protein YxeA
MKKCNRCGKTKPLTDFHKNPTKSDGVQSMCKDCRRSYHKEHYEKNKESYKRNLKEKRDIARSFILNYKKISKCSKCGEDRHYTLDFHHKDKNKEFSIADSVSNGKSIESIKKEIDKCIILCSNCHRELHFLETQ